MDFGAKGDGRADDTAAFRAGIEQAREGSGDLEIPPGRYLITGEIIVSSAVRVTGASHRESVISSGNDSARFLFNTSAATFRDIGFENMVEPIALVPHEGYVLRDVSFIRCRFENIKVQNRNRGVIGLRSGARSERIHKIQNLVVEKCLFKSIDAHAINIRGNISNAIIIKNQFLDIVNDPTSKSPRGGFAIRLGESSDDVNMIEEFRDQGNHLIERNLIRNLKKETKEGNLIGILIYGNYNTVRNNTITGVDGSDIGNDTNAIYIRGAYNSILSNIIRDIRGSDDDGALTFKGGLNLGNRNNIVSHNRIENIFGMSAVEASTSDLLFSRNEIINATTRGFQQRMGDGLTLTHNEFRNADTDIRTQGGRIEIVNNKYIDSRIWLSQRRANPSRREAVIIKENHFKWTGKSGSLIGFANSVEERFLSIINNYFEISQPDYEPDNLFSLKINGLAIRLEVSGNSIYRGAIPPGKPEFKKLKEAIFHGGSIQN